MGPGVTPPIEEWDIDDRRIHFDDGAHNRGILYARGTSAMALQVDILRRGVDVLAQGDASAQRAPRAARFRRSTSAGWMNA